MWDRSGMHALRVCARQTTTLSIDQICLVIYTNCLLAGKFRVFQKSVQATLVTILTLCLIIVNNIAIVALPFLLCYIFLCQ